MEIEGKIIDLMPPKTGESARGSWKKQEIIIETDDTYPKKVCLINWNDKINIDGLNPGVTVKAYVNIESREYNGNWFTDVKVWKIDTQSANNINEGGAMPQGNEGHLPPPEDFSASNDNDSEPLPF